MVSEKTEREDVVYVIAEHEIVVDQDTHIDELILSTTPNTQFEFVIKQKICKILHYWLL